jgi:hypothetical protein
VFAKGRCSVGNWSDTGATPLTSVVKQLSDVESDPFCFSFVAVEELSSFDDTFALRLFNLAGAFALDGLGPAGALGVFELSGSTPSASALMSFCKPPQFFSNFDSLVL